MERELKTLDEKLKELEILPSDIPDLTKTLNESLNLNELGHAITEGFTRVFAEELVDGFLAKQGPSQQLQYQKDGSIRVSATEVINKFLAAKRATVAEATIDNYRDMLNHFARRYPILPTKPEDIEEFLASKPTKRTAFGYYGILKRLYDFANKRLGIANVMEKIEKPRYKGKDPDYLTKEQAKVLLDVIETDRERAFAYLYLGEGLRLSEAIRLDIRDVGQDLVRIKGKERDERMPLLPEVRDSLLKLIDGRSPNEPIFISQRKRRISKAMVEFEIKRLFQRAGIDGVKQSPHTLRHTFATIATSAGCDSYSVERLLRHRSTQRTNITYHYIHLNMDELREKLARYSPLRTLNDGQGFNKIKYLV